MADLERIKSNVAKMAEMGAPEADIDGYIASEGVTLEAVRSFKPKSNLNPLQSAIASNPVTRALAGGGGGLIRRGAGVVQAGAELVGAQGVADKMGQVVKNVNANLADNERFGTAGRVGAFAMGDVAPFVAIPAGAATVAGRAALGALGGAVEGVTRGNETSDLGQRLADTATSATIGAVAAPIAGAAGDAVQGFAKGFSKGLPVAAKTADDVKGLASEKYAAADKLGGVLKANITNGFIDDLATKLQPQTDIGRAVLGDGEASKLVERLAVFRDKPLTLQAAQELDEGLSEIVDKLTDKGQITKEARRVLSLQDALRNRISSAAETDVIGGKAGFDALAQGRSLWKQSIQMRDIERIIERAELSDNPAQAIRSGLKTLSLNPERMRSYSPEIQKMIKSGAKSNIASDALRVGGSRLIPIVTASTGNVGGAIASQAATTASRGVGARIAVDRALEIIDKIANNAPRPGMAEKLGAKAKSALGKAPDPRAKPVRRQP